MVLISYFWWRPPGMGFQAGRLAGETKDDQTQPPMTDSCFQTLGLSHEGGDPERQGGRFTCAPQLFLWDLYSSINAHCAVIKKYIKINSNPCCSVLLLEFECRQFKALFFFLSLLLISLPKGCVFCIILLTNSTALQGLSQNEQQNFSPIYSKIEQTQLKIEVNLAI